MSSESPAYIGFEEYSKHVPQSIPAAVQQATSRFVGGRAARVAELPQWEQLRQSGSDIRLHTIENLDMYIARLETAVQAAGGIVHRAATAQDARQIVLQIAKQHNVKLAVKSKSMATEEIGLNHALEAAGIEALETDLGEYIIQLAGTGPSHIIVPAVHLKKEEIATLFSEKLGIDAPPDPIALTKIAREILREKFLSAEMGISGANFLVAETGTLVMVTNEGNGRMCSSLPDLHVAVVGIDKVIPDWEALTVFLQLLARSATGQKLSTYTQFITGPRRAEGEFGPKEFHLVLLDNGRSRVMKDPVGREVFKCIRCGACANVCPVYKNVGGFAYGWFISGPIGAIFAPQMLGTQVARELPYASTLCGACAEVCPVKIPIPSILRHLRRRVAQGDEVSAPSMPAPIRAMAGMATLALSWNWIYRFGTSLLPFFMSIFKRDNWIPSAPYPLSRWTMARPLPSFTAHFRQWWKEDGRRDDGGQRDAHGLPLAVRLPDLPYHADALAIPDESKPSTDSQIEQFLDEIKKLSGVGQRLNKQIVFDALKTLVTEQNIRKATVWDAPLLKELDISGHLRALGVELVSPNADKHEMALCDLGITTADALLPETGTLVLRSSAEKPRGVSLLPRIHLAIVTPDLLRANLLQVFAEAQNSHYLVFITGPSRTADIELTVTLGVHGPKNLFVWMLER